MVPTQVACRKCGNSYVSDPLSLYTVCSECRQPESSQVRAGVMARSYEGEEEEAGVPSTLLMKVAIAFAALAPVAAVLLARLS